MHSLVAVLLSFPTVIFTLLTALSLLYWLFVILGALDIDSLGSAAGAGKGAFEGAAKGAIEGVAGAAKGAMEGVTGGAKAVDLPDGAAGGLSFLRLRDVPVTITLSFFSVFGLLLSSLYGLSVGPPGFLLGVPIFLGVSVLSLLFASFAVRPVAPLFQTPSANKSVDFVGKVATISTGRVSERFGQATLDDGGAGLIIEVREGAANALKRGDRVILIHWDTAKEAFEVEKVPDEAEDWKDRTAAIEQAEREAELAQEEAAAGRGRGGA